MAEAAYSPSGESVDTTQQEQPDFYTGAASFELPNLFQDGQPGEGMDYEESSEHPLNTPEPLVVEDESISPAPPIAPQGDNQKEEDCVITGVEN